MNNNNRSRAFLALLFIAASFLLTGQTKAQSKIAAGVGNYQSGSVIPKAVFNTLPGVGVYVRDLVFEVKYTVVSYTLKLADNEGNLVQVHCQGSAFSNVAKQYINDFTKPGDVISIQNIKAKDEGGREVKLPALLYYIE